MKSFFKHSSGLFVLMTSLLFANQVLSSSTGQGLQDYVNQLQTFKADFVQTQPDEAIFALNTSTGHFELNRPGQLVWEYFQPEEQKIVVDGPNLWVHDLDLDQVTVRPIDDVKAELPLSWLLYREPIQSKFMIIESGDKNGMHWFNLTPKQATYFQSIEVGMKDGEMVEVWMYQSSDNITKVRFTNIQSNLVIPYKTFQFQVPEGADLVGTPQ
ncbi:outer membrane lipoprotein chaperone LolA [Thiomicrorhabdus lithotrophica]|uniref:Outer-membrane lipoprotein carrier protein n=1 Tax=Thiomicrorhabdus lithotrophica TaxID=2949997 RepID=A0ABY8CF35_9GAMM|nr:outer membrane lipoprotein chaperone LolA [Thiomicrorhabdus lithotrophica]WEJ63412.1 outer membrane lipoprotein chaperone LolA [Thiomicrorhabdus lithotrophica]